LLSVGIDRKLAGHRGAAARRAVHGERPDRRRRSRRGSSAPPPRTRECRSSRPWSGPVIPTVAFSPAASDAWCTSYPSSPPGTGKQSVACRTCAHSCGEPGLRSD
jgi:hypothetical protein